MPWDGNDRRQGQQWRIKKEVSIGDIIAFAIAALAVVSAYWTLDKRLAILEASGAVQQQVDQRQDSEFLRYQARIDEVLKGIDRKLDRIIEGRSRPGG